MTVVLVHGNPETAAIWGPLRAALGRDDVICLSPPGFGAPPPAGWTATRLEYRNWLVGELEALGEPVDLVGHDWGGGHVMGVAMARPDLLRSWVSDIVGVFDPDYVWHEFAQVWQAPEAGEAWVEQMLALPDDQMAAFLASRGITADVAAELAAAFDETMGRCILALYRSAAQPALSEAGRDLAVAAQRPGLALLAELDVLVGTDEQRRRSAARAGARVEVLAGRGHWWMLEDPEQGAAALTRFWADLPPSV